MEEDGDAVIELGNEDEEPTENDKPAEGEKSAEPAPSVELVESSFPVYAKLANLYTVRNEMLGLSVQPQVAAYSEPAPPVAETLGEYGDSDFLAAASGKDQVAAWKVDTLQAVNRRAYDSVMRKLERL